MTYGAAMSQDEPTAEESSVPSQRTNRPIYTRPSTGAAAVAVLISIIVILVIIALIAALALSIVWLASACERLLGLPAAHNLAAFFGIALLLLLWQAGMRITDAVRSALNEQADLLHQLHNALWEHSDELPTSRATFPTSSRGGPSRAGPSERGNDRATAALRRG
jgi:hypothetical protein